MLLLDLLAFLTTPCSWLARSRGFLASSLQVQARHRRCARAWQPHLHRTRKTILAAADLCSRRRTAVVIGGGMLHDIPLRDLSQLFEEVVLADIVFPWSSRWQAALRGNVRCLTLDVTETMHTLSSVAANEGAGPQRPVRLLEHPTLDFTVSVNVLSQLPIVAGRVLRRAGWSEDAVLAWSRRLQEAHLQYLREVPGRVALITDTHGSFRKPGGAMTDRWDNLHGVTLPPSDEHWEWMLAPAPEKERELDLVVEVAAFHDWKKSAAQAPV